jgi:transposase
MAKITASFENHVVYVGLDIHKRNWNAAIYLGDQYVGNIHQPPSPNALCHYLRQNYPAASYMCAYECGEFGYWVHREFKELGVDCIVVNPADIPSTHKDEVYKNDQRDARGIGRALSRGQLKSIYVPYEDQEADRHLVRQRKKIWSDLVRCKNRIKGFLDYKGIPIPEQCDNANWSRNFIGWLSQLEFTHSSNRVTLNYLVSEMELLRKELLSISNQVRKLMRSKKYNKLYYLLRSVTGIGPLTPAALITEIGDMKRFNNFYHLNSFIGLMPMEHSSGERELKGRITVRKHRQLRSDLVECAWTAKRTDPVLSLYYSEQIKKGKNGKAAIVKVARKLLSRIRYVWLSSEAYQTAVVK